ncbi:NrdH-redoxin [Flavobacteriales bacterium 34_180_T64]|nr:NrdH-redoxin [Flavobacteriales bacterium 34_180_T64]
MNSTEPTITLYGTERCHKTDYYKSFLIEKGLAFEFKDVELNQTFAKELRSLYENGRLNFPTLTIGGKRLRNPNDKDLNKWLTKLL